MTYYRLYVDGVWVTTVVTYGVQDLAFTALNLGVYSYSNYGPPNPSQTGSQGVFDEVRILDSCKYDGSTSKVPTLPYVAYMEPVSSDLLWSSDFSSDELDEAPTTASFLQDRINLKPQTIYTNANNTVRVENVAGLTQAARIRKLNTAAYNMPLNYSFTALEAGLVRLEWDSALTYYDSIPAGQKVFRQRIIGSSGSLLFSITYKKESLAPDDGNIIIDFGGGQDSYPRWRYGVYNRFVVDLDLDANTYTASMNGTVFARASTISCGTVS